MRVAALIVTRNRRGLLEECLEAVGGQSHPIQTIVVVDNASDDGTADFLKSRQQSGLIIERLEENTGGAGGFAHGIEIAARLPVDFIWLMDDDCIPTPTALERLVSSAATLDEAGHGYSFLCSRVIDTARVACNHPVPSQALNASGWPRWADLADKDLVLVDECTFVSVAVPVNRVREVGLPFREMFIWGDDTEYTRRLSRQAPGVFVGASEVLHKRLLRGELSIHNDEAEGRLPFYQFYYRNRVYVYRTYFPRWRFLALLLQYFWEVARLLGRGRFGRAWLVIRGTCKGLFFNPPVRPASPALHSRSEVPAALERSQPLAAE